MALSAWQATIVNESGDVIPSAQIQVIDDATGLNADIFANSGGTPAANPFTATAGGFAQFYANAGTYRVIASDSGTGFSETWEDQRLGDAQARDTGTGADQVPTNGDLPTFGTAATKDTGTDSGQVPTADDLGVVGKTNYHSGNLNVVEFGGVAAGQDLIIGFANSSTSARFYAPIFSNTAPTGITTVGTFAALIMTSYAAAGSGVAPTVLLGSSSNRMISFQISGLTGLSPGDPVMLRSESASSKITVNF